VTDTLNKTEHGVKTRTNNAQFREAETSLCKPMHASRKRIWR